MTWSPVSTWGAKIGLCFPRRTLATSEASRPSTAPSASTTYQRRSMSRARGEKVLEVVVMTVEKRPEAADQAVYRRGLAIVMRNAIGARKAAEAIPAGK